MKTLWLQCVAIAFVALLARPSAAQAPTAAGEPELVAGSDAAAYVRPVWSPAGDRIAFAGPAFAGLFVADVATGDLAQLSSEAGAGFGAEWSHDGAALVTRVSPQNGMRRQHAVKLFEVQTGREVQLTDYRASMRGLPTFGADGSSVLLPTDGTVEVFEARETVASKAADPSIRVSFAVGDRIASVSAADRSPREILRADGDVLRVATSRVGDRIAYEVLGGNLYVVSADGSSRVDFGRGEAARFSPDGQWIVFMRTADDGHHITSSDLFLGRVADGSVFQLTSTPDRLEMNPDWSPDGSRIAFDDRGSIYVLPLQR